MVLKIAMQMNHAKWLPFAAFHIAINFQTVSQIARIIIVGMSQSSIE